MASSFEELKAILGKPFFESNNAIIFNMDCLKAMKALRKIEGGCLDLTVTSPPYNIGKEYEENLPVEEYLDWCKSWISEIHALTKAQGTFWLNLGYLSMKDRAKAIPIPYLLWDKVTPPQKRPFLSLIANFLIGRFPFS